MNTKPSGFEGDIVEKITVFNGFSIQTYVTTRYVHCT